MTRGLRLLTFASCLVLAHAGCSDGGNDGGSGGGSATGGSGGSVGGSGGGTAGSGGGGMGGGAGGGGEGGGGSGGEAMGGSGPAPCPEGVAPPSTTFGHASVWSPRNGELVIFGGDNRAKDVTMNTYTNAVWSFRPACGVGGTWERIDAVTPPDGRADFAHAYDPKRDRLVIFGGRKGESPNYSVDRELWIFEVHRRTFRKLNPSGKLPVIRDGASAVWDAKNDRMILFGGNNSSFQGFKVLNDTWALSFKDSDLAPVWTELNDGMTGSPPKRWMASFAADPERGVAVLFGGQDASSSLPEPAYYDDVWLFDFSSNTWLQLPADADPDPERFERLPRKRFGARMEYAGDGSFLVFAGIDNYTQFERNDLWKLTLNGDLTRAQWAVEYFGDRGTRLVADVDKAAPERRGRPSFTVTPEGDVWTFGGNGPCGPLADMWTRKVGGVFWTPKIATDKSVNVCWRKAEPEQLCAAQQQCSEPR